VSQVGHHARFALKQSEEAIVGLPTSEHSLDHERALKSGDAFISCEIDLTHSAARQQMQNPVTSEHALPYERSIFLVIDGAFLGEGARIL
jgi:hypothetical protein